MNKVYVVYESRFGDLLVDCNPTEITGVYTDIEKARQKVIDTVNTQLDYETVWVVDENNLDENNNLVFDETVIMFWNSQENWGCHYEINIKEMEVK